MATPAGTFQTHQAIGNKEDVSDIIWDISPDDQRFLMVTRTEDDGRPRAALTVVTNWFDELRARVKGN